MNMPNLVEKGILHRSNSSGMFEFVDAQFYIPSSQIRLKDKVNASLVYGEFYRCDRCTG